MTRKALTIVLAVALVSLLAAGGAIAYLTGADSVKNTFTVGSVKIAMDEARVTRNADSTWTAGQERVKANTYENIYPGAVLPKDPIVHNVGANAAYVRAKVTIKHNTIVSIFDGDPDNPLRYIQQPEACFLDLLGAPGADWTLVDGHWSGDMNNDSDDTLVFLYGKALAAGDDTTAVFQSVTIPTFFDGELDPAEFGIDVVAEAIQAEGFSTPEEAFAAFDARQ